MGGRTTPFGSEPQERLDDFGAEELPDDQVVRRFFAVHEREARHGERRRHRPSRASGAPAGGGPAPGAEPEA